MTVGDQLATARTQHGLSLEQLASRTKIPVSGLRALEGGQYERLPAPIFTRGYIHAAAVEVGLDPDRLVQQFEVERPQVAEPAPRQTPSTEDWTSPRFGSPANLAISAVALLALVTWIWVARDRPETEEMSRGTPPDAPTAATPPVGTAGTVGRATQRDLTLKLNADRECWVSLSGDGERKIYRLLQPGEQPTVTARERILLRVGDAGAISLSVNGGPFRVAGEGGEVRTLTFTADREQPR